MLTTCLIVWPRRKLHVIQVRTVVVMRTVAEIVFHRPARRWKISHPVMKTPSKRTPGKKGLATPIVRNVHVAGVEVEVGVQRVIAPPMRSLPSLRKPSSMTNLSPMTMMGSGPVWPHLAAAPNAAQPPTAQQRIVDARAELLMIAAIVPRELRRRRRVDPSSDPAAIATKTQIARPGLLVQNVALAMMLTVPPAGNQSGEMRHDESPLAVGVTKKSKPRDLTVEVAMTDRPVMTVVLVMTAPHAGTLLNAAVMRPTRSLHGQLRHVLTAVNGMTVPHVVTRPIAVATGMRTPHDLPVPTPLVPSKAVAMIGLLAEIVMTGLPAGIVMIVLPAETVMTARPAETTPRVRIVAPERPRVAPSRASLPLPAAIGRRRTPKMTSPTRLALGPRRSMPRHGNMPSRC